MNFKSTLDELQETLDELPKTLCQLYIIFKRQSKQTQKTKKKWWGISFQINVEKQDNITVSHTKVLMV